MMRLSQHDRAVGAAMVLAGVLFQVFWLGQAAAVLSVALIIAYVVWIGERWQPSIHRAVAPATIAVAAFALHAIEEFVTGFYDRFPALLGDRWNSEQFLIFIAVWFITFVVSV
jgi:hypothetical protein